MIWVCDVVHLARYLSDHAPVAWSVYCWRRSDLRLNWRLFPEILLDPEGRDRIASAHGDYFDNNWSTADTRATKWEAMKAVVRGHCIGLSSRVRQTPQTELTHEEGELARHHQLPPTTLEDKQNEVEARRRLADVGERLSKFTLKSCRQLLHREGERLGRLLAWIQKRENLTNTILHLRTPSMGDV